MEFRLLGAPGLTGPPRASSQPLTAGKPLALLAYLACVPGRAASRDRLIDLLWAHVDREAARHTLRQTVWYIRRRLDHDPFVVRSQVLALAPGLATDRDRFLDALDATDYSAALAAYSGDFFPGFSAPGGAEFERWADLERMRLRALYVHASETYARALLTDGRGRDAVAIARRARDLVPDAQTAWRLLLDALLAANDRVAALVEAEQLERWLHRDDLPVDTATLDAIRLARREAGRVHSRARGRLEPDLVGREAEFTALVQGWADARRGPAVHVHVAGQAGLGKSRLLNGLARRLRAVRHRVVMVRALQADRDLPFALAADLTVALARLRGAAGVSPDAAGALVALAPAVSAYLSAPADRATGDDAVRRRTLALRELVTTIADDDPVAILVDDLHWADPGSRAMLASVAAGLGGAHVLLVTASRHADPLAGTGDGVRRLNLQPLSEEHVGVLVRHLGELPEPAWGASFVDQLARATHGSPLLVLDLLQLALEQGLLGLADRRWSCPDPVGLERLLTGGSAVRQRLAAVGEEPQATLLLLAVLGSELGAADAHRVRGEAGAAALLELEARGLLHHRDSRWSIAHDEIATLARELATPARLVQAHREAATVLEAATAPSPNTLLRAAAHRYTAGQWQETIQLLTRAAYATGAAGDRDALARLARSVIGTDGANAEEAALVAAMPWRARARTGRPSRGGKSRAADGRPSMPGLDPPPEDGRPLSG